MTMSDFSVQLQKFEQSFKKERRVGNQTRRRKAKLDNGLNAPQQGWLEIMSISADQKI